MEILASTIGSIVTEIGKCLHVPVERHIGYLIAYKRNVETLRNQVQKLGTIRDDVKRRIELAKCSLEVIRGVVEEWITKVDRIEEEARSLDVEVNENERCFGGWCPNFISRHGLGKKAEKMVLEVNLLQLEGEFSDVSDPAPPPSFESIHSRDFLDFGSTKSTMNQIKDALKDEKIKVVGVYGLGGVGKTSLMEQVGKQMKHENRYNKVVKVTVSQNPVLEKIQAEIAEKLGLELKDISSKEVRAEKLCTRLKQEQRVLLILDDLWGLLELPDVGIPNASEHEGCQIVLTTRNSYVCSAMMSQKTIEVKVLSPDDSWLLFKKYAGDFIESPSFHNVAKNVVNECGGLPLVLVALGRALREKDVFHWDEALEQLKRSNPTDIMGVDTMVFERLLFSYNSLGSEEMKSCFLFCCLFPEDYNIGIEELIQYGIGERLYKDDLTFNQARRRIRILVENLKARCLLLEGDRKECVKMHDILRDLAIKISAENEDKFLVKARQGLKRWPEREEVDKCYKISLMYNEISILPDQPPTCPKLRTLILSSLFSLKVIPDNFFDGMKNLVVLDLSHTSISVLPSSFSRLINLRTLSLKGCRTLKDISLLGKLKTLEILRLDSSSLNSLPEEIGELTNLKLLDLEGNWKLEIVPPNVISRLTFLEELYMRGSFALWELDDKGPGHNASFAEVASLAHLTVLHVHINDAEILSQENFPTLKNLTEFDIGFGDYIFLRGMHSWEIRGRRRMELQVSNPVANWVKELAERTEELHLTVPENSSFENVKPLLKSSCLTILYVYTTDTGILSQDICCRWTNLTEFGIFVGESAQYVGVPMKFMMSLEVCGPIAFASWVMELAERTEDLRLKVDNNFVDVVPLINRNPNSLKTLCLEVQQEREHLIKVEDVPENAFGRLESLYLSNLGKVKKLCEGPIPSGFFGNLRELRLWGCNNLRYLWPFFPCHASQKLELLQIFGCKEIEGLIPRKEEESVVMEGIASPMLSESHTRNSPNFLPPLLTFQNLRKLKIWSCPSLKYIFSWKFANGLNQLEELNLRCCDGMEVIFAEEGMVDSRVLPQLKTLVLRQLRSLVSFFQGEASLDMTSLEVIIIEDCKNLKRLPLGTQSAPNLKKFEAEKEWFEGLEWREGSITKSRLHPLFKDKSERYREQILREQSVGLAMAYLSCDDHAETSAVEDDSESFDQAEPTPAIETGTSDQAAETFANEADSRVDSESGPESMH